MSLLEVSVKDSGQTLLSFLRSALSAYPSVKAIKRAIDAKQCKINGRVEFFSTHRLRTGDLVEIVLEVAKPNLSAPVLFEDSELILFDKPAGKTSESFEGFFLVHRLDKETSGVILFAKTPEMRDLLISLFSKRKVDKEYLAICDGKMVQEKWVCDDFLGKKAAYQGGSLYGKVPKEKGKRAVTHFELLRACETASYVLAKPITGRTHQVRVHLRDRGHPVLGDWQYGKQFKCPLHPKRHLLHARLLFFVHPTTGKKLEIRAPLSKDFLEAQKMLFGA
ncbi:MAG: Ribosomal large subunit pseudouridine synthase C [Chlamydiae bacterium]|nr:Ribosomal large subunit pseudouridine synthase C [Chlamydiota bacterium]